MVNRLRTNAIVGSPVANSCSRLSPSRSAVIAAIDDRDGATALGGACPPGDSSHNPELSMRAELNPVSLRENACVGANRDVDCSESEHVTVFAGLLKSGLKSVALFAPIQFDLPADTELRFQQLNESLSSSPQSVEHLTKHRGRDWFADMREQILGAFHEGLVAAHYHLVRIQEIERSIAEIAQAHGGELLPPGATLGLVNRPLMPNTRLSNLRSVARSST